MLKEQNEMKEEIRNPKKPHCITCRKILEKNSLVKRTKQNKLMPLSNCANW